MKIFIYTLNEIITFVFTGIKYYQKQKLVSQYVKVMSNMNGKNTQLCGIKCIA